MTEVNPTASEDASEKLDSLMPPATSSHEKIGPSLEEQLAAWKSHAELWEGRAKANRVQGDKLSELEAESKQLKAQIATFEAEKIETLKLSLASKYSLPEAIASRLSGKTSEEIEADAKTLAEGMGLIKLEAESQTESETESQLLNAISKREDLRRPKTAPVVSQGASVSAQTPGIIRSREDFRRNFQNNS